MGFFGEETRALLSEYPLAKEVVCDPIQDEAEKVCSAERNNARYKVKISGWIYNPAEHQHNNAGNKKRGVKDDVTRLHLAFPPFTLRT